MLHGLMVNSRKICIAVGIVELRSLGWETSWRARFVGTNIANRIGLSAIITALTVAQITNLDKGEKKTNN